MDRIANHGAVLVLYHEGKPEVKFWHLNDGDIVATKSVNNAAEKGWIKEDIVQPGIYVPSEYGALLTPAGRKALEK